MAGKGCASLYVASHDVEGRGGEGSERFRFMETNMLVFFVKSNLRSVAILSRVVNRSCTVRVNKRRNLIFACCVCACIAGVNGVFIYFICLFFFWFRARFGVNSWKVCFFFRRWRGG